MNKTYNIFHKGKRIENNHSDSLAKSIIGAGLREGDRIKSTPFNLMDDENTEFKKEPLDYQCIPLEIIRIEYNFIDTWNGCIRIVIDITIGHVNRRLHK